METAEIAIKTKWILDPTHTQIAFKVKHLMISHVKGVFKEFGATIETKGEDFMTADIKLWVNPASLDTGDAKRDEHLMGPDFFDVKNNPKITFTANTSEKADNGVIYGLYGDLVIKGIAKRIKLNVVFGGVMKDPWGNEKAGFTVKGNIDRKNWGLTWNAALEAGGMLVSDDVLINCEIELTKQL
jgi:polyisoprenoid-binding protein YceI